MVKRKHALGVNWRLALAKVMASSKTLNNQTALAKKTGVAQSTIGRILRAEVDPQVGNLERIAEAFALTLAQLAQMGQEDDPAVELPDTESTERSAALAALSSWIQTGIPVDVERAMHQALAARNDRRRAQAQLAPLRHEEKEAVKRLQELIRQHGVMGGES
jgi:transcriptional regulator with XRE-family HTH domain